MKSTKAPASAASGAILVTNSTTPSLLQTRGGASQNKCPERGTIWLQTKSGYDAAFPTTCKAWFCMACRDRKLNQVKGIIASGLFRLGPSHLLTLTYRTVEGPDGTATNPVYAKTARRHLEKFWRLMKLARPKDTLSWFMVPELTIKKQVHFHLVIGGIHNQASCRRNKRWGWKERNCDCFEHTVSKVWESVTKSYIVDVRPVSGMFGAAMYLSKYLIKGMSGHVRERLEELGYIRRFSRSRNWPDCDKMQRRGTVDRTWHVRGFHRGNMMRRVQATTHLLPEAEQVGEPYSQRFQKEKNARRAIRRMQGDLSFNGQIRPASRGYR